MDNTRHKIALGKLGRFSRFDSSKWGAIGGDCEPAYFYYAIAKMYPQYDFYIISKSDYTKMFPKKLLPNLFDIWSEEFATDQYNPKTYKIISKSQDEYDENDIEHTWKYLRHIKHACDYHNIKFSYAFLMHGIYTTTNIPWYVERDQFETEDMRYYKVLEFGLRYVAPINYFLNETQTPYSIINTDPRQFQTYPQDLLHWPDVVLSQIDNPQRYGGHRILKWHGDKGRIDEMNKCEYSGVETMILLHKKPLENNHERTEFNMILNQGLRAGGNKKPPRYLELNKWLLNDKDFKFNIYGKWDDDILNSDSRFKGPVHPMDIDNVLNKTKYTLCIPIKSGWMTAKFIEMCHYGVVPFVTSEYAAQCKNRVYIPDALVVNNTEELINKMKLMNDNPELYNSVVNKIKDLLKDKYSGKYLFNKIREVMINNRCKFILPAIDNEVEIEVLFQQDKNKTKESIEIDTFF